MHYDRLDDFVRDLPALALRAQNTLRGHDGAFTLNADGQTWYIRLSDGALTLPECPDGDPDCAVETDSQTLLGIINGDTSPAKAILLRKIRVKGDIRPLFRLIRLMG